LEATLRANPGVKQVVDSGAALPPGHSVTLNVTGGGPFNHVSVAAMLVPTNDAFFALNGVNAAPVEDSVEEGADSATLTFYSPAYDAGTEEDDELCINIPGPPNVCSGEGFNAARDDVNFVHIHSGIHGIGDLAPALYDWRNPVARITITMVR
jgi:hypothetical protein